MAELLIVAWVALGIGCVCGMFLGAWLRGNDEEDDDG